MQNQKNKQGVWRVISIEEEQDSFMKMAVEESIMNSVRKNLVPPTLRFYAWNKPAVSLGFFQEANKELDLEVCKKDNIEIFRRITGGGAVYKSPEFEINYSFIIKEDQEKIPKDVEESYRIICNALIIGLKKLGFETKFKPINDIIFNNKKISGNAQTRVDNVLLHHGTILLKPEVEKMFKYLKIDDKKLFEKKVNDVKELVTGLCEYKNVCKKDIEKCVLEGFKQVFQKEFIYSELTEQEIKDSKELYKKYNNEDFVYWR